MIVDIESTLEALGSADMEVLGLLPYASNATLLVSLDGDEGRLAVYKPRRGERPLWDFPDGTLCLREYAAFVVDRALGWGLVPPTVLRDGPAGFGAVQAFVTPDEEVDVRGLVVSHEAELRRMAALDVVINNADRKAGHLIVDLDGRLWGVDHGVTFNVEPKLRTVIWTFEGDPVPDADLADLGRLAGGGEAMRELGEVLMPEEIDALCRRVSALTGSGRMPSPGAGRRHVPWPPW